MAGRKSGYEMNRIRIHIIRKIVIAQLILLILIEPFAMALSANKSADSSQDDGAVTIDLASNYNDYVSQYKDAAYPDCDINFDVVHYTLSDYKPEIKTDYAGDKGKSLLTSDSGYVEWTVDADKAGFYNMEVSYYPVKGKSSYIERSIWVDGKLPFEEARSIKFDRVWTDKRDEKGNSITRDENNNDVRPDQIENPKWLSAPDSTGFINHPLYFYLTKGRHTVRFISVKEPILIKSIKFYQTEKLKSYSEVKSEYEKNGYQQVKNQYIKFQAESPKEKSNSMIVPVYDRSNAAVEPNDIAKLRLNCIGADKWETNGDWVSWDFTVPETGLYKICVKAIQNTISGAISSRRVFIDGKVPFKELDNVTFPYSTDWKIYTLGGDKDPYQFYLKAGKHELKLQVSLGSMSDILQQVNEITKELNNIYRQILFVTGPTPDVSRDYQFSDIMPDVLADMKKQSVRLKNCFDAINKIVGANGQNAQILYTEYLQLSQMVKDPSKIADWFSALQTNISSLGTWVMTTKYQPLTLDYFVVESFDREAPKANAGFFENFAYQFGSFIASFYSDYNTMSTSKKGKAITVWYGGGRDQAQVLKNLTANYFTSRSKINVNLQIVPMGTLMPATLAGKGPDVALGMGSSDVCNYAFRNAVVNLRQFSDFDSITKRYSASAITPLSFQKGVYGLPETQTFPMLFYRKDILAQLKLKIPQTWTDVVNMLPILQKKQLNFGVSCGNMSAFVMMLYQNGGQLYTPDGSKTLIDSKTAINTFSFLTSLYTDYQIPQTMDFLNRFRSGEVPIGIVDYSLFNQLSVFAPELNGLWDFTLVPGTEKEDGTIDRSACGGVSACIIMAKSKKVKDSWEFLKWWTSSDIQVIYGLELESIMGPAARYTTANIEALYKIPWSASSFKKLTEQWKWVKGIPEVPGGYYTSRYIDFAFKGVVNNSKDPADTLVDAASQVNAEINVKRREFKLTDVQQGGVR